MRNILKPKRYDSVKDALVDKALSTLKALAFVAIFFLAVHWLTGGQDEIINGTTGPLPERPPSAGSPQYVLDQHKQDCWTKDQTPKAELPGAAIIQWTKNGMVQYTTVHWKVDAAFNEALADLGYDTPTSDKIDVLALCVGP